MFYRKIQFHTLLFFLVWRTLFATADPPTPYRDFSNAGVGFQGCGRELAAPGDLHAVRIGLTGPKNTPEGEQLHHGVALAVEQANERGGHRGIPYAIVFRPDDGHWGSATKEIVHLIYEDKVWAILGALDGGHAHLAELISAKAWIPVVTPCASDLTIDYANVPWVFRCAPDDGRQADALLGYARKRRYQNLVALTEGKREAYRGFLRLQEKARRGHSRFAAHLEYSPHDPTAILDRLKNFSSDAILLWGNPSTALPLLCALRKSGVTVPVLGPALLATPDIAEKAPTEGELIVAAPYDLSLNSASVLTFKRQYQRRVGSEPTPIALLAYDAARSVIVAIERAGLNRARIRDELSRMSFKGLTGRIHFNSLGGNSSEPVLMVLRSRQWVRVE